MLRTWLKLTLCVLASAGCATQAVPQAVDCPPPPAVPRVLKDKPALTGQSSSERTESSLKSFEQSLQKAVR